MLSFISKRTLEDYLKQTYKILGKYWIYIFKNVKTINFFNKLKVNTVEKFKILNSILKEYENFNEIKIKQQQIEEISDIFYTIKKNLKSFIKNKFHIYPEIFFSSNELKNINIISLISGIRKRRQNQNIIRVKIFSFFRCF